MVRMTVEADGDGWRVGGEPGPTWRTARIDLDGGWAWWGLADAERLGARGDGAPSAWVDDLFGPAVREALRAGEAVAVESAPGPRGDAARRAALAWWRAEYWPASRSAGVLALDPRLVAVERAFALLELGAVAPEGALVDALREVAEAFGTHGPLADADALRELAARYGGALPQRAEARAEPERAPAAPGGMPLMSGTVSLDVTPIPAGVIDATGDARWSVRFGPGGAIVSLEVPTAPTIDGRLPAVDLRVDVAGLEAPLALSDDAWRIDHPVPADMMSGPPADAVVRVFVPDFGEGRDWIPSVELIRVARARLSAPESPAEVEAAGRG